MLINSFDAQRLNISKVYHSVGHAQGRDDDLLALLFSTANARQPHPPRGEHSRIWVSRLCYTEHEDFHWFQSPDPDTKVSRNLLWGSSKAANELSVCVLGDPQALILLPF